MVRKDGAISPTNSFGSWNGWQEKGNAKQNAPKPSNGIVNGLVSYFEIVLCLSHFFIVIL